MNKDTTVLEEKRKKLEELRRMRRKHGETEQDNQSGIDAIVNRILQNTESYCTGKQASSLFSALDGFTSVSTPLSGNEKKDPITLETEVKRYDKSIQTAVVESPSISRNDRLIDVKSAEMQTSAPLESVAQPIPPRRSTNSVTAIKKKITVMRNEDGMEKIAKDMEDTNLINSVNTIERALYQMQDYDYLNNYISNSRKERDRNEDLVFSKQYFSDTLQNHCITSIAVSPFAKSMILTTYQSDDSEGRQEGYCVLWDLMVPGHPYRIIVTPESVTCGLFHPANRNAVLGCLFSGRVIMWNLNESGYTTTQSNLNDTSHNFPIYCLECFSNNSISGYLSISNDGQLCVWSCDSVSDPILSVNVNSLSFEGHPLDLPIIPTIMSPIDPNSSSFLLGSEDGTLYSLVYRNNLVTIEAMMPFHSAPITRISVNLPNPLQTSYFKQDPYISGLVLTSSLDWTIALWLPSVCASPLLVFRTGISPILDVAWNPLNPAVFAVAATNGCIELWYLLQDRNNAIYRMDATSKESTRSCFINVMKWSDNGKQLFVGMSNGSLQVYNLRSELLEVRDESIHDYHRIIEELITEQNNMK